MDVGLISLPMSSWNVPRPQQSEDGYTSEWMKEGEQVRPYVAFLLHAAEKFFLPAADCAPWLSARRVHDASTKGF
jgi:hypothetical protein